MERVRLKQISIFSGLVVATIVVAYVLGALAGGFFNAREVDRFKERRVENKEAVLAQMGTIADGDTLPDIFLHDLAGEKVYLRDIIAGRSLLMFFEPDCELCLVEMETIQDKISNQNDFERFIMVSQANPLQLIKLRDRYQLQSPVLYDSEQFFRSQLKVFTFPFNMIIDRNLVIEEIFAGGLTPEEIIAIVEDD